MRAVWRAMVVGLWALAAPVAAQEAGRLTVEIGGQSHQFTATGVWETVSGLPDGSLRIGIDGLHVDGTEVMLNFTAVQGRADELLFRFREPDTAKVYGREWTEGPGFRVTLSELRREGDVVVLSGSFRGPIVNPYPPGGRARIRGSFALELAEPIYSPN